jgi:hypothetical protein
MSFKIGTETSQKKNLASILRAFADMIESSSNKRVQIELELLFKEDK